MNWPARRLALVAAASLLTAHAAAEPTSNGIATYQAEYRVEYRGRFVGRAHMTVSYDEERDIYVFESITRARGLARLIAPGPITEKSHFVYEDGEIRPLEFWLDDGSRRGTDNLHIAFDWDRDVAIATDRQGETELSLRPGVLDRATMQVAVMHDMATREGPDRYVLADGDSLRTYEYTPTGEEVIATGVGEFQAQGFVQRREGSSRTLSVWGAPELDFLPVRIEQHRDGELQWSSILESVNGLPD
jgi:hypothetical protein